MHDSKLPGVELRDPFSADGVWRSIDSQLQRDMRRQSVTLSAAPSRGQERTRDVFVRRASEETAKSVSCAGKWKAKIANWLRVK